MPDGFSVGDVPVGKGGLFLIAGPCVIESEAHALKMADAIASYRTRQEHPLHFQGFLR